MMRVRGGGGTAGEVELKFDNRIFLAERHS